MQTNHLHRPRSWSGGEDSATALCGALTIEKPSDDPNAHVAWWNPSLWLADEREHKCPECLAIYALTKDDA